MNSKLKKHLKNIKKEVWNEYYENKYSFSNAGVVYHYCEEHKANICIGTAEDKYGFLFVVFQHEEILELYDLS